MIDEDMIATLQIQADRIAELEREQHPRTKRGQAVSDFHVGQRVEKFTGDYVWEGVICAIFMTPNGNRRIVVAHPVNAGYVLHIYSPHNLREVKP